MSCQDRLLPMMMVGKKVDQKLIGNYMKKKHLALSQLIGKPETCYCYYSSADFHRLISLCTADDKASGLRMYFACFTHTGLPAIDAIAKAGHDDMFTIIFAPTFYQDNFTLTDLGSYFMINPIGGGVIQVTKKAASKLVERYNSFKKPLLEAIINDAAGAADRRETQSLWRELDAFTNAGRGLLAEMDCQGASGITAFLGSYDKGETHPDPNGNDIPVEFQLTLIFDFVKEIDNAGNTYSYHFDIDDQDDYAARRQKTLDMVPFLGADTLNPCPPATTNCSNL